jgi:predicted dinucleotide-binding enzyme
MKIAVLGTGMVGQTIATKLVNLGHEVALGARDKENPAAKMWHDNVTGNASIGTFDEVATGAEVVFNCVMGQFAIEALQRAGAHNLRGKVVVDVTNPLDFSRGMPPTLFVCNDDSLGERVQRAFPEARVVKALNSVNAAVMVDPSRVPGESTAMYCGDDHEAKVLVAGLLQSFGWKDLLDLGDISGSRQLEMYVLLWVRLWGTLNTADFNVKIVR